MAHKHLIIGGGFAGLRIARLLANREDIAVTVVSPQANFEYHGSLYRSANGYSPLETVIPYRDIFHDSSVTFIQDFMVDMNPATKRVKLLSGRELLYDTITLAMGYEPEYFGIPGMREFSKTLYSLADALELRKTLKQVAQTTFTHARPARVIVAGGGPTGVETVASIPHFFELLTGDQRVEVTLVEAKDRILSGLDEKFALVVAEQISAIAAVRCSQKVIRATKHTLYIADAQPLPFDILVWTSGSSANGYFRQRPDLFQVDRKGRAVVDEHLQAKHEGIYIAGDSASTNNSGTAHAAIEMGSYVAADIIATLYGEAREPFNATNPEYAVPTGHNSAVAMRDGFILTGSEGWQQRRQLDLSALNSIVSEKIAHYHWGKGDSYAKIIPQDT